jgi:serine/threonine protein kinase
LGGKFDRPETHSQVTVHIRSRVSTFYDTSKRDDHVVSIRGINSVELSGSRLPRVTTSSIEWYSYSAPEITATHDHRVDLWSLGAVLYTLLCGHGPFTGDEHKIRRNKRIGFLEFHDDRCPTSQKAKRLVRGLMERDPRSRLSIAEIERHEWMMASSSELDHFELGIAHCIFKDWDNTISW